MAAPVALPVGVMEKVDTVVGSGFLVREPEGEGVEEGELRC